MAWYKLYADFGPGHQSNETYYKWLPDKMREDERREIWENAFREEDSPRGYIRKLRKLSEKIRIGKINEYKGRIKRAREMLEILNLNQKTKRRKRRQACKS